MQRLYVFSQLSSAVEGPKNIHPEETLPHSHCEQINALKKYLSKVQTMVFRVTAVKTNIWKKQIISYLLL